MEVEYFYQARQDITARAQCLAPAVSELKDKLNLGVATIHVIQSVVHDRDNNHIANVTMHWQIKPWSKVTVDLN